MRLTERFPALIPLRLAQRTFCFYLKMKLDHEHYAHTQTNERLCYLVKQIERECINTHSGYDITYQYNKLDNFKVAAKTMQHLLIRPGETFSFWQCAKHADKQAYKEGLCVINGKMSTAKGGGLCGLSNQLFELFLHSDLTMIERHPHSKEYILPKKDELLGVDASVIEGWKDLKFKNETNETYQIVIEFHRTNMMTALYSTHKQTTERTLFNRNRKETETKDGTVQKIEVAVKVRDLLTDTCMTKTLYENTCLMVTEEKK